MKTFTVEEAGSNFSSVLRIVRGGEEVAVTSRQKTVAKIMPVVEAANGRRGAAAIQHRKVAWANHGRKLAAIFGGRPAPGQTASQIIIEGRR